MAESPALAGLSPELRLALAYAPAASRGAILALFALDSRLAGLVRTAREPLPGQLRLAWWRERLAEPVATTPAGEPLLAMLALLGGERAALTALADGWEALLVAEKLDETHAEAFADGRAAAFAALARALDGAAHAAEAARAGRNWALADLAAHLGQSGERAAVAALLERQDWRHPRLPRGLRPFAVLHALAASARGGRPLLHGPAALLRAARAGFFGR